jgi:putative transposase
VSAQLGSWLVEHGMKHTRAHPMTRSKSERYHRSLKNQILLENYYLPGQLKARLADLVDYYNSRRYHESLNNLTYGRLLLRPGRTVLSWRGNVKLKTIEGRRQLHLFAAKTSTQMNQVIL